MDRVKENTQHKESRITQLQISNNNNNGRHYANREDDDDKSH